MGNFHENNAKNSWNRKTIKKPGTIARADYYQSSELKEYIIPIQ